MNSYVISNEERDRLNILKFIAIVFVVYHHSYAVDVNFAEGTNTLFLPWWLLLTENLISKIIATCGVPLFFLISSVLLFRKHREYKETITGKIKTLLIPYFIWNSFWVFVFIVLQNLRFTASYFSGNKTPILEGSFYEWLALYGIGLELPFPQDYPLWFVRDLMLVTLLFPVIERITDKFPKQLLAVALFLLAVPIGFPLKEALLWSIIGACAVRLQIHITFFDRISMRKFLLIYIICMSINLAVNIHFVNMMSIFVGVIYWIKVTKSIFNCDRAKNAYLWLSQRTFIIFVAHEMTLSSLKKICFKLLPTEPLWLLTEYIFLPVAVICMCVIVGKIFKKVAPGIYSISTGAR